MRVLIIGASSGIGLEATRQALFAGYQVRALARSVGRMTITDRNLEKFAGDALSPKDMRAALVDVEVAIQTLCIGLADLLGPVQLFSDATKVLIAAMNAQGVKRLISVTGFGAGDSRAGLGCLQRLPFLMVLGRAYDDKDVQERLLRSSGLDWTIARPGILTSGPQTGRYRVLRRSSEWRNGMISRADVAGFLVRQIKDRDCIRQAPVLVN
jgi:uncharacterized protein YbjT (DUF2867 family)